MVALGRSVVFLVVPYLFLRAISFYGWDMPAPWPKSLPS